MAALADQPGGQLAGERVDGIAQAGHLLAGGVHEVDVRRQRLAQRLGHGLNAAVGHQPAPDLGLDLALELGDVQFVGVALQAQVEVVDVAPGLLGHLHETLEHALEVEIAQRAVQVVGASDGTARLHPRIAADRLAGRGPKHLGVASHQGPVEHLGQFLGTEHVAGPAQVALGRDLAAGVLDVVEIGIRDLVLRAPQREVHLEDGLESLPVSLVLHQSGGQGVLEGVAVLDRDVLDRLHGVEVLGEAGGDAHGPQLRDEAVEQVQQRISRGGGQVADGTLTQRAVCDGHGRASLEICTLGLMFPAHVRCAHGPLGPRPRKLGL